MNNHKRSTRNWQEWEKEQRRIAEEQEPYFIKTVRSLTTEQTITLADRLIEWRDEVDVDITSTPANEPDKIGRLLKTYLVSARLPSSESRKENMNNVLSERRLLKAYLVSAWLLSSESHKEAMNNALSEILSQEPQKGIEP